MKRFLMIALLIGAIPAVAVGQTVMCDECTHVASVYMGEGGFIATADDADMVTWVASCGGVTRSGEEPADDDGVVSALWTGDLACMADGGTFEIGPVMDGGWFWVTDDTNSAVGGLISKDVLDNETADITSAGDSVSMTMGKGAVFLKHTASGRVGILPNILPEMPMEALRLCGANDRGTTGTSATAAGLAANARFTRRNTDCALGDGGTTTLATTTNPFSGATTVVADGASVVRPSGTGSVVVTVDLWGNGSGHFTTALTSGGALDAVGAVVAAEARGHALLGQSTVALSPLRAMARLQDVTYRVTRGTGPGATGIVEDAVAVAGIAMDGSDTNVVALTITADTAYCNADPPRDNPVQVSIASLITVATNAAQVTPSVALARDHAVTGSPRQLAGGTSFTVVCGSASSSANMGQELVPENPFPTDR